MTPYEMRQKAARNRTEANVLEESAQILRSVAASIDGLLSGIAGMSRMVWQGPAATSFEEAAASHDSILNGEARVLRSEADGFDAKARTLRSEASWLDSEADRLEREAMANLPPGVS